MRRSRRIPGGWVIDWRDVARLVLQQIEREDPALVERLEQPDPGYAPLPGAALARLSAPVPPHTRAGERELARLRGEDPDEDWDDEGDET